MTDPTPSEQARKFSLNADYLALRQRVDRLERELDDARSELRECILKAAIERATEKDAKEDPYP